MRDSNTLCRALQMPYVIASEGLRNNVEMMLKNSQANQFLLSATNLHLSAG